jgi:SAM-dependent methyltransferase
MDLPLELLELALIRQRLEQTQLVKEPYLEVGCGDGFNLEEFSRIGMRGAGIDISAEAVAILKAKNLPGVAVISGDFLRHEFPDRPKVVFMLNCLEHIPDDHLFIERAAALLADGGYLVIATPAHQRLFGFADANAGHVRRYERADLEAKLRTAGFAIDTWYTVGFPVNRSYTWLFNALNKGKRSEVELRNTERSGIRHSENYYGGIWDVVAKVGFPVLKIAIWIDRLFVHTDLGNNFVVFARKTATGQYVRDNIPS